jgi:DMSO/TMAO reductase YedYZ molybdopterin-dependent catalytic subunit
MHRPSLGMGALLGALISLPLIALLYLGQQLADLPFVPFDIFDWLARVLPGNVITLGIGSMVSAIQLVGIGPISSSAKRIEQSMGILLVIGACVIIGIVIAWILRRRGWQGRQVGAVAGLIASALILAIEYSPQLTENGTKPTWTLLWLPLVITSAGALLGWLVERLSAAPAEAETAMTAPAVAEPGTPGLSRRAMLARVAGASLGAAVVAYGLGSFLNTARAATGAGQALGQLPSAGAGGAAGPTPPAPGAALAGQAAATPALVPETGVQGTPAPGGISATPGAGSVAVRDSVPAAPGTRPELTDNADFYRIDIDTVPPVIQGKDWELQVRGLFDKPRALKLNDLMAFPAFTQPITQSCISNPIGGDLISTTNYTGARLRDVLQNLGMRREATALNIVSADGFYESVDMADLMDPRTLLVYGMNGTTLPIEHGYPLRIYRPNRYGMKQPKWITMIEAVPQLGPGYWVDRGWSLEARPQVISVIDTVAKNASQNGKIPIGGIAWAGDRGIQKVEVQVDNGPWEAAILRTPPLSPLTWVQWRYDWPSTPGQHRVQVRAVDGHGQMQIGTPADTYPDGATGYDSVTVRV